jgi:hypothetical protein
MSGTPADPDNIPKSPAPPGRAREVDPSADDDLFGFAGDAKSSDSIRSSLASELNQALAEIESPVESLDARAEQPARASAKISDTSPASLVKAAAACADDLENITVDLKRALTRIDLGDEATPAATPRKKPEPVAETPRPAPAPARFEISSPPPASAPSATASHGAQRVLEAIRPRLPSGLRGLLMAMVAANITFAVVSLWSVSSIKGALTGLGQDLVESVEHLRTFVAAPPHVEAATEAVPPTPVVPEGQRTLALARERLARRDWKRARTLAYDVLAVIDTIGQPARDDVEAQANLLIAESYAKEAADAAAQQKGKAP